MRCLIFSAIFFANTILLPAQAFYPFSAIPKDLLPNADLVIRKNTLTFEVINKGEAIETEYVVLTLLNEKAAPFSEPQFHYDDFEKIEEIEASVYDAAGKLVRNLKKKDIEDIKPLQYYIYDYRLKVLNLPGRSYPYTIAYTVTKKHHGLMFYPTIGF